MFGFYLNYNVYESDILRLGGAVEYTNKVVSTSFHSFLEEAVVSLDGHSCVVHMERYKKGNDSVVVRFVEDGVVKDCKDYEDARQFMISYNSLILKNEKLMVYAYTRKLKICFTGILQTLCVFSFLFSLCYNLFNHLNLVLIAVCIFSGICFFSLGKLYYFYREVNYEDYKPFFKAEDGDEGDDGYL